MTTPCRSYCREYENSVKRSAAHITRTRCSGESRWRPLCRSEVASTATLVGSYYTAEKQQRTVVPTTADERIRESTTLYKPLCGHCSDEIGALQVQRLLNTLRHGTDDDDDEMQLVAQTAQQLESRRCGSLNYAELAIWHSNMVRGIRLAILVMQKRTTEARLFLG